MSYIILDDIPLKVKSIDKDPQPNIVNKAYVDGGSSIKHKGFKGKKLGLTFYVGKDQIQKVEDLLKKTTPIVLTSESKADYNSQYYITDPRLNEGKKGVWTLTVTLVEYVEKNVVWVNFEKWNVSNGGGAAGGDEITTIPLTGCPTLSLGDRGDCVGELQTYLKLLGYYVYSNGHSLDVDYYFGNYTEESVKAFQRAHGLTATGVVGPETKAKMTL